MRGSEKRWAVNDAEPAGLERRCHLGSTVNSRLFGMSREEYTCGSSDSDASIRRSRQTLQKCTARGSAL